MQFEINGRINKRVVFVAMDRESRYAEAEVRPPPKNITEPGNLYI